MNSAAGIPFRDLPINESQIDHKIRDYLWKQEGESERSKRLEQLALLRNQMVRVKSNLKAELNVIILRRVVPGRCRYCPI